MLTHCLPLHLQKEVASERRLPVTEKNKVSLFITLNLTNTHDLRKEGIVKNALTSTVGRFCQKTRDAELWQGIALCKAKRIGYFCWQQKTTINVRPFCLTCMGGEDLSIQFYDKTVDLKSRTIFFFTCLLKKLLL